MSKMVVFLMVMLCDLSLTSGVPANFKCLGRSQNGQIHYTLSPDITEEIRHCEAQWIVNDMVAALYDGNGNTSCVPPIIRATVSAATMEIDPEKVEYNVLCPDINVPRKLPCSYLTPAYTATHAPLQNKTSAEDLTVGFPKGKAAVIMIVGFVFLSVIIILFVLMKVRKRSEDVPTDKEVV